MNAPHPTALLVALAALGALGACKPPPPPVTWRDDFALLYSNTSVLPSDPPRHLWTRADEELLQRRLGFADCVAIGRTKIVTTYSTFSSPKQLGLSFRPSEIIHGSLEGLLDGDGDLILQLTPASTDDFQLAIKVQRTLAGTRYLVFLKQQPQPGRGPVWHWALYRDDPELIREVRASYELLRREREKKGSDAPPQ